MSNDKVWVFKHIFKSINAKIEVGVRYGGSNK
jgi:hypothetical protein